MADGFLGRPWCSHGGGHVAAADQSTLDGALCAHGHNAASVPAARRSDLAGGEAASQLHSRDGQRWWKEGQRGPPRTKPLTPNLVPAGGDLYLCILLYLFICLANQLGVTFPS